MDAQRAIVTVKWGPSACKKAVVSPGSVLRVGRGDLSDLVIPSDAQMSAVHLEIAWDGERCHFRDLESAKGTLHNGASDTPEGELKNGDWLRAGDTVLTVHLEGSTPPRPEPDDDVDEEEAEIALAARKERAASAETALSALSEAAERRPLYVVLDSARDRRILELCRESVEEHRSLYDGVEGETLAHVAPYLVRLGADSRLLSLLVREGWAKRWGIYLTSPESQSALRRHLRRYLMVHREDKNERMYFRFYDPAVLRVFLPVSTVLQRSELFGAIDEFMFEGERGAMIVARAAPEEP